MARDRKKPNPARSAPRAARILLANNLKRVHKHLRLAATNYDGNTRDVHQLRISTRRSIAVLDMFREFIPEKRRKNTARQLNSIRASAGKARDLDVLIQRYRRGSKHDRSLVKKLKKKRNKAQRSVVKTFHRIKKDDQFEKDCRKLQDSMKAADDNNQPSYALWAGEKLGECVRDFFDNRPDDTSRLSQLHRFRIAAKRFRYSLELLEPAFPDRSFKPVKPDMRRLQDLLGEVNDHAVAVARIHRMQGRGSGIDQKIQQRELDALIASRQKFAKWWTPHKARRLKRQFWSIAAKSSQK